MLAKLSRDGCPLFYIGALLMCLTCTWGVLFRRLRQRALGTHVCEADRNNCQRIPSIEPHRLKHSLPIQKPASATLHYAIGPSLERLQCKASPILIMPRPKHILYLNHLLVSDPIGSSCHAAILNLRHWGRPRPCFRFRQLPQYLHLPLPLPSPLLLHPLRHP